MRAPGLAAELLDYSLRGQHNRMETSWLLHVGALTRSLMGNGHSSPSEVLRLVFSGFPAVESNSQAHLFFSPTA